MTNTKDAAPEPADELWDANDAARYLKVSRSWVYQRAESGRLPWGRSALGELCSGDVHFLIELVGKMVASSDAATLAAATPGTPAIAPRLQNKAIRSEAGNFLRNLRSLPRGQELVEVVEAFGNVAASYLRHRDHKNEADSPPHQAARIEPYDDPKLGPEARAVYNELLRYSVFIEDVRGKSRRGHVVPRLYLRRFLIPVFSLTFSKRDSLELNVDELNALLLKPREFEAKKRLKASEDAEPTTPKSPEPKKAEPQIDSQLPLGFMNSDTDEAT
jgi:hypothetical protein